MRSRSVGRFLTSIVIASFALAGPLAPLAHAQQSDESTDAAQAAPSTQAAEISASAQAAPTQPMPPTQPDLFQETLKAEAASGRQRGLYATEAVFVNLVRVPGKTVTCAAGTVVGLGLLIISFGSGYRPASAIFHEGCTGKWWLSGDDIRPDMPSSLAEYGQ